MSRFADDEEDFKEEEEEEEEDDDNVATLAKKSKLRISSENVRINEDDILADEEEEDDDSAVAESDAEDSDASEPDDDDEASIEGPKANVGDAKSALPRFADFDELSGDDEDSDDDDDENYLQKFDEQTKQNIVADYHPEMQAHNYDEIDVLSHVVRNDLGVIIDPLHRTLPFITKYEKARILGERAKQINSGAKIFVHVEPTVIDGYLIALKEFEEKKIPFILRRPLPNGGCEYWRFSDLEIL